MRAYVDSDVLIWHLRGEPAALRFLRKLAARRECELWIGAMQRAEVVFHMRPDEEEGTELFLAQFKTAVVDQAIVDAAARLYRKWNRSHGVDVHDAFLAAAAMKTGGTIYTLNVRHYPMPGIAVEKAW